MSDERVSTDQIPQITKEPHFDETINGQNIPDNREKTGLQVIIQDESNQGKIVDINNELDTINSQYLDELGQDTLIEADEDPNMLIDIKTKTASGRLLLKKELMGKMHKNLEALGFYYVPQETKQEISLSTVASPIIAHAAKEKRFRYEGIKKELRITKSARQETMSERSLFRIPKVFAKYRQSGKDHYIIEGLAEERFDNFMNIILTHTEGLGFTPANAPTVTSFESEFMMLSALQSVVGAFESLNAKGIQHNDQTLENILISSYNFSASIIDFGLAKESWLRKILPKKNDVSKDLAAFKVNLSPYEQKKLNLLIPGMDITQLSNEVISERFNTLLQTAGYTNEQIPDIQKGIREKYEPIALQYQIQKKLEETSQFSYTQEQFNELIPAIQKGMNNLYHIAPTVKLGHKR